MKRIYRITLALLSLLVTLLIVSLVGSKVSGLYGIFQPHDYNWSTGMSSLQNQVAAFQHAKARWPRDYDDLTAFMKQSNSNFVSESYDRIDFTTNTYGNLEIVVYGFNSGVTNHIIMKAPRKQ